MFAPGLKSTADGDFAVTKKISAVDQPLIPKDQTCCLIGKAGPLLPTKAASCVVQISGCFATEEERQEYIEEVSESCGFNMLTVTAPMQQFVYIGASEQEPAQQLEIVNRILNNTKAEWAEQQDAEKETIKRIKARTKDATGLEQDMNADLLQKQQFTNQHISAIADRHKQFAKDEQKNLRTTKRFSALGAIPNQSFAAISIARDPYEVINGHDIVQDWAVCVWKTFSNSTDAHAYLSDTLQHEMKEFESYIVPMYKEIFLEHTRGNLECQDVHRFDVQTQMYSRQDETLLNKIKDIPVDENGRMIKDAEPQPKAINAK